MVLDENACLNCSDGRDFGGSSRRPVLAERRVEQDENKELAMKLYVGNLTYGVNNNSLETLFTPFGEVRSAQVVMDRDTGRSKGFGFVEMGDKQAGEAAIADLNGKQVEGRALTVNEARPREERSGGGGFRSGSGGRSRY